MRQPGPIAGPYDHGQVTVTLNEPLSLAAYREVQHRVAAQQSIRIPVRSDPFVAAGNGGAVPDPTGLKQPPKPWRYVIQEKYPPLPRYAGVNVWGPLRSVTFANVTGSASVGNRQLGLPGAPDVTLSGVKALRSAGGEPLITAPLETAGESAQLEFRAVANVAVNGQSETTLWQAQKPWLAIVALLCAGIGTAVGVLSYARSMRHTLRQNTP